MMGNSKTIFQLEMSAGERKVDSDTLGYAVPVIILGRFLLSFPVSPPCFGLNSTGISWFKPRSAIFFLIHSDMQSTSAITHC